MLKKTYKNVIIFTIILTVIGLFGLTDFIPKYLKAAQVYNDSQSFFTYELTWKSFVKFSGNYIYIWGITAFLWFLILIVTIGGIRRHSLHQELLNQLKAQRIELAQLRTKATLLNDSYNSGLITYEKLRNELLPLRIEEAEKRAEEINYQIATLIKVEDKLFSLDLLYNQGVINLDEKNSKIQALLNDKTIEQS